MSLIPPVPPLLEVPLIFCAFTTFTTYVLSIITGNVSQVDRLWTFLPTIYTAYWALYPLWPHAHDSHPFKSFIAPYVAGEAPHGLAEIFNQRALLMLALQSVWTIRLSYNTWRRGLFRLDEEDYRWAVFRKQIPVWLFQFFNFSFIAITQNILLLGLAVPTYWAVTDPTPLSYADGALVLTAFILLAYEFTADNQQYAFHAFKASVLDPKAPLYVESGQWPGARLAFSKADATRGFLTRGLWAWSRHPNFFAEQAFWGVMNLLPLVSGSRPVFYPTDPSDSSVVSSLKRTATILPALALNALFLSSTLFTERISMSKYPKGYSMYKWRVGMFVPWVTVGMWAGQRTFRSGEIAKVDELVWGAGAAEAVAKEKKDM